MSRLPDWPERLGAVLRAAPGRAFVWGGHDCALHASDAALAITGVDPAAAIRGRYGDYMGGMRLLAAEAGCRSLRAWADSLYARVEVAMAQRGDWALVKWPATPDGRPHHALTLVDGDRLSAACGVRLPLAAATICWRVE